MRVLLLGGTGDALKIARRLGQYDVYSLAGLGRVPDDLPCRVRVGGFGGAEGLARYLESESIDLLIDATHPYAARMSANAAAAGRQVGVTVWSLWREPWQPREGDDWRFVPDWPALCEALAGFSRPLFTLGRAPLSHLDAIPSHQRWVVRCLDDHPGNAQATVIGARGPFTHESERALFVRHDIDVVVSKHSGGAATEAKLDVAREHGLPVVMLARPAAIETDRTFACGATLLAALDALRDTASAHHIQTASRRNEA
ncbi:cobalt-precorrin-6A reductase [Pandoraea vervacti]|uniref:Cobalt-precorrin-6A reductase n=1 Tax=Pandoraea vervacti TaxID=656178 RepID=A0ABN4U832_9BURK|nr:cobalt-precorrin-6A reductase [Pandoraea vervacti]APD11373.1 cobalt-precorrin-6A reductase [Pandoraea vervacti]